MNASARRIVLVFCGVAVVLVMGHQAGLAQRIMGQGPSLLRELERKAEDRDFLARRYKELETELQEVRTALSNEEARVSGQLERSGAPRLMDLERKALEYDNLVIQLERRDARIEALTQQVQESRTANEEVLRRIDELQQTIAVLSNKVDVLEDVESGLRNTVQQLLFGNYEYYEVRAGDTVESIAAQPTVYGDAARQEWIRQANFKTVQDIDHLRAGEMLVVPRFPASGRYDF